MNESGGDAPFNWREHSILLIGALEEIRRETREMRGGWRARVAATLDRHLGGQTIPETKSPWP